MTTRQLSPKKVETIWRQRGFHFETSGTGFDERAAAAAGQKAHAAWWNGKRAAARRSES